ncbi:MAG: outer membrane lipoprotein chaperone LolA [Gammaproteobacteria bacterium]|nr:outer membrane lipoprotein chaperone LolA [Gammaproteobacteria bacterium]
MKKLFAAFLFVPSVAFAAPEVLERFLNDTQAYQADFVQRTVDEAGEVTAVSSGSMALKRGEGMGQFRWQYQEPWEQLIIGDGQDLWQYDADLEQATKRPMQESLAGTPAELLVGGMLLQDWNISQDEVWLTMKPKDNDLPFQSIALRFEGENLAGMKLLDQFDQTTHVVFDHIDTQPAFAANTFVFNAPEGTEIIGAEDDF